VFDHLSRVRMGKRISYASGGLVVFLTILSRHLRFCFNVTLVVDRVFDSLHCKIQRD